MSEPHRMLAPALLTLSLAGVCAAEGIEQLRSSGLRDFEQGPAAAGRLLEGKPGRKAGSVEQGLGQRTGEMYAPEKDYTAYALCRGSSGKKKYDVCLSLVAVEGAGHDHQKDLPAVAVTEKSCRKGIAVNSKVYWHWTAPVMASRLKAVWSYSGSCAGKPETEEAAGVPGLAELGPADDYTLIGVTDLHQVNHFGTKTAVAALQAIGADYRKEFPNDEPLAFNDMSLHWGGLFDIGGDWKSPHITHRLGQQADVRMYNVPEANRKRLFEIFKKHGARLLVEEDHFHLDFATKGEFGYQEELVCD